MYQHYQFFKYLLPTILTPNVILRLRSYAEIFLAVTIFWCF